MCSVFYENSKLLELAGIVSLLIIAFIIFLKKNAISSLPVLVMGVVHILLWLLMSNIKRNIKELEEVEVNHENL